jgi:hypothetical protein
MPEATAKRRTRAIKVDHSGKSKAQVLKFDRHAGLVVMEKSEPALELKPFVALVRNLLAWLRLIPPVSQAKRYTKGKRSR